MAPRLKPSKRGGNQDKLTAQQQIFIEAYFADRSMNAEKAARKAGYKTGGSAVLANQNVRAIVSKRLQEMIWEHRADRERVLKELMSIAFQNPQDLLKEDGSVMSLKEMPPQVARSIRKLSITYSEEENEDGTFTTLKNVSIDFWDKMYALDLLTKHLGMMEPIKHEVKHNVDWDTMVIPHAIPESNDKEIEDDVVDPIEHRIRLLNLSPVKGKVEVIEQ